MDGLRGHTGEVRVAMQHLPLFAEYLDGKGDRAVAATAARWMSSSWSSNLQQVESDATGPEQCGLDPTSVAAWQRPQQRRRPRGVPTADRSGSSWGNPVSESCALTARIILP